MALSLPVPLDQLATTGSTLTIEETVPTTPGGQPRRLVLVGPALPRKGANWDGDTRVVTTWYPGNGTEATQQNMGPVELPSSWNGVWKRTMMGRAPSVFWDETGTQHGIIEPWDLWEILDSIRIAGARVRVTWAVRGRRVNGSPDFGATDSPVDRSVVREGRLKKLSVKPDTEVDIEWVMDFDWQSRGGRQEKASDVRRDDDLGAATSALSQSINALDFFVDTKVVSAISDKRLTASKLTLGQLEKMAAAPKLAVDRAMSKLRYNVNQFKRVAEVARKLALTPYAMANSVVDFARNSTAIANQFISSFDRTPPELLSNKQKVSDLLRSTRYFGQISDGMSSVARDGAELDGRLRLLSVAGGNRGALSVRESSTTRAGEIIAIHVVKEGETPIKLSMKYYRTPDQADLLLRANRLPLHTPTLRKGQILIIPALATKRGE